MYCRLIGRRWRYVCLLPPLLLLWVRCSKVVSAPAYHKVGLDWNIGPLQGASGYAVYLCYKQLLPKDWAPISREVSFLTLSIYLSSHSRLDTFFPSFFVLPPRISIFSAVLRMPVCLPSADFFSTLIKGAVSFISWYNPLKVHVSKLESCQSTFYTYLECKGAMASIHDTLWIKPKPNRNTLKLLLFTLSSYLHQIPWHWLFKWLIRTLSANQTPSNMVQ